MAVITARAIILLNIKKKNIRNYFNFDKVITEHLKKNSGEVRTNSGLGHRDMEPVQDTGQLQDNPNPCENGSGQTKGSTIIKVIALEHL